MEITKDRCQTVFCYKQHLKIGLIMCFHHVLSILIFLSDILLVPVKKNTNAVTRSERMTEKVIYKGVRPPFSESNQPNIQVRKLAPDMMQTAI